MPVSRPNRTLSWRGHPPPGCCRAFTVSVRPPDDPTVRPPVRPFAPPSDRPAARPSYRPTVHSTGRLPSDPPDRSNARPPECHGARVPKMPECPTMRTSEARYEARKGRRARAPVDHRGPARATPPRRASPLQSQPMRHSARQEAVPVRIAGHEGGPQLKEVPVLRHRGQHQHGEDEAEKAGLHLDDEFLGKLGPTTAMLLKPSLGDMRPWPDCTHCGRAHASACGSECC